MSNINDIIGEVGTASEKKAVAKKKPVAKKKAVSKKKTAAKAVAEKVAPVAKQVAEKKIRPSVAAAVAKATTTVKEKRQVESLVEVMKRTLGSGSKINLTLEKESLMEAESAPVKVQNRIRSTALAAAGEGDLSVYARISLDAMVAAGKSFTIHTLISHMLDGKANGVKDYTVGTSRSTAANVVKSLLILGAIEHGDAAKGEMKLVQSSPVTKALLAVK